ncbi:winged helix-turn-helix transcriptional regulator [Dyadobacter arcticus]|uniref:DNA-binding HxlR family transcriptional regulator n=1 Tax=Dyadobacter arcticus TaxID=1078754 RepID=A0ABX0UNP4_9BACT|nr:helix-turn-helix domain-containing protein [Dyadobacter arcticus]NIJ54604.1 DNA-binding HxlR family transcriptional regulator [Dyadobacter arcticus]
MRKTNSTNHVNEKAITINCPITSTMLAIGGRWKIVILWQLKNGSLRYNEIRKAIPNISEKMLIQQLKELMQSKWVDKKDYNEIPPRTEYSLTQIGKSFMPILENIYNWGIANNITAPRQEDGS